MKLRQVAALACQDAVSTSLLLLPSRYPVAFRFGVLPGIAAAFSRGAPFLL
jgi:hypothetical protein